MNARAATATMTQAEFARHLGVSRFAVTHWKQRGLLVLAVDGMVDVKASEARLRSRPEVYRGGRVKGPNASDGRLGWGPPTAGSQR